LPAHHICEKKKKNKKWRRRRRIPFYGAKDGPMAALVRDLRDKLYKGNPKARVFQDVNHAQGFNVYLERACGQLNLVDANGEPIMLSQHDLRHVFATRCVEAGVSWKVLAEWLGHEDGGVLAASTYCHLRREHEAEMASRLGKSLNPGITVNGKHYTPEQIQQMEARLHSLPDRAG
jgi:site-specific recombinase XerD